MIVVMMKYVRIMIENRPVSFLLKEKTNPKLFVSFA